MNTAYLIQKALLLSLLIGAPLVLFTVVVGLLIGFVQAVMQLQEQSLPFGIKLVGVVFLLVLLGHWMTGQLLSFLIEVLDQLPYLSGRSNG